MLIPLNITGGFYKSRSLPLSAQVTRNMYPEVQENPSTQSPYVLQSFPGQKSFSGGFAATTTDGVVFDGSDYLTRGAELTGAADSKVGTVACRIKFNSASDGVHQSIISYTGGNFAFYKPADNKIYIFAKNSADSAIFNNPTSAAYTGASGWLNILISFDMTGSIAQMYVNDVDVADAPNTFTNDTIDYTRTNTVIGAEVSTNNPLDADVDFIWQDQTVAIDFSVTANRRKFFTADGRPVSLGADGSTPTGTAPIIYLDGDSTDFATNKGTGGGFTTVGTLTDSAGETFVAAPDRGIYEHQGVLYQVYGTAMYSVTSAGVRTSLGTIAGTGQCIFTGIGSNVIVVTEGKAYVYNGSTVTEVSDTDLETPNGVAHLNNQVIYDGDAGRFASSDVGDASSIDGLNYATAESNADVLQRPYVLNQTLYLMGDKTIEQWWNSGSGSPPFDRIEGGILPVGLKAIYSVADNGSVMYFLGDDLRVYAVAGSEYKHISTIPLSNEIEGYTTLTDAVGTYFTLQGQGFYQLTFPQDDKSWVFHEQSGEWFENSSGADGGRAVFNNAVNVYNKVIASDYASSALYELDVDTYTENGTTIIRQRDTAPLHGGLIGAPGKSIEMNRLELIMETGVGDLTATPEVIMTYSDDGGRTWSTESWGTVNVGTAGNYIKKIEWFSLGTFEERVFRFKMSEGVRWTLFSAAADIEIGI